ncbi:MAG: hypothetical protein KAH11_07880 [Rhodospirillales bacterium]|nr:hypothetical protein [Rhodospirillales bacterium]
MAKEASAKSRAVEAVAEKAAFGELVSEVVRLVESEQKLTLVLNKAICDEVFERAVIGLESISGIPAPDEFKIAAEHAFWIRKLKPCRHDIFEDGGAHEIFLEHLKPEIKAEGLDQKAFDRAVKRTLKQAVSGRLENDHKELPRVQFLNEMVAVRVATKILEAEGIFLHYRPEVFHDLISTLRYNSVSPGTLRLVFEAMNPPELDMRETRRHHANKPNSTT